MNKIKVSVCYCGIPFKKLAELVRLRFVAGIGTQELMKRMKSEKEREYLATVALLDVSEKDLIHMAEAEKPEQLRHFLDCRAHVLDILKSNGLEVKER